MKRSLQGKSALVTGASSGIGRALAMSLDREGCRLALAGRSLGRLEQVRASLSGQDVVLIPGDLAIAAEVDAMAARALEYFDGALDIFLANAGLYVKGEVAEGDPDAWDQAIAVNVNSVFRACRAVLPSMIARRSGDVIVTSSISGHIAIPWEPVYSATKHAVQSFVHGVRRQVSAHNVRVGAVAPGMVLNELWGLTDANEIHARAGRREGLLSEDVAEAVVFMLTRPPHVTIRDLVMLPQNQDLSANAQRLDAMLFDGGQNMEKPLILVDPLPRTLDSICDSETRARLERLGRLVICEDAAMSDEAVERHLPEVVLLLGQTDMPRERIARAPRLKAIFNVETNFLPNVDYAECHTRGIWVLSPTSSFAEAVAESALGMAIDLARGITAADRAFRAGEEKFGLAGNERSFMFTRAPVGIIGFGDLGRKLRALIAPFRNAVKVYDPWLPDDLIRSHDCAPVGLDELLSSSRIIFMFASVTTENQGFIGKREFELMQPGAAFLLMSRAAVVDFPEFLRQVESGRIVAATDVFPKEPVDADDPVRHVEGLLLSAHRTGGMVEALHQIGRMVVADAELILRGLPPQLCRRADPSVASRLRSMPAGAR